MKKIVCILLLVTIVRLGFAQVIWPMFPKADLIAPLKGQTVYVGLLDTSDEKNKLFAKSYNLNIQAALKSRWTYTSCKFVKMDSLVEMKEHKEDVYVMIPTELEKYNFEASYGKWTKDVYNSNGELIMTKQVGAGGTKPLAYSKSCWIMVGKAKDMKVKEKLFGKSYSVVFNNPVLGVMSSSFSYQAVMANIAALQTRVEYVISSKEEKDARNAADKANNVKLRTKVLYLDKDLIDSDLTEASIKEVYTYPFKIVGTDEIVKAIDTKDPNVVFLHIDILAQGQTKCWLFTKNADKLDYNTGTLLDCGEAVGKKKLKEINELASRNK